MNKRLLILIALLLAVPLSTSADVKRVDISPMLLVNLSETTAGDAGGRLIGGAVAGDFYFSNNFALRATVGYIRNRYGSYSQIDHLFTTVDPNSVGETEYSLRFSVAPYAEADIGGLLRPYVTINGSLGYYGGSNTEVYTAGPNQSQPLSNASYIGYNSPYGSFYSLSASLGFKLPVAERISFFAEVDHDFYSNYLSERNSDLGTSLRQTPYGFNDYRTFLAIGLAYRIDLGGKQR